MDRDHFTPNFDHSVLSLEKPMPLNRSVNGQKSQLGLNNTEIEKQLRPINVIGDLKLARVSSTNSLRRSNYSNVQMKIRPTIASPNEGSSVSEQIPIGETEDKSPNYFISRKRKSVSKGKSQKVIVNDQDDQDSKRCKTSMKKGIGNGENNTNEKQDVKTPEPLKDYIHVRARRGQATDSHSLAERVRREKIGERMKLLQDLVPGCNKVTGKALMLDEIINYVQSLQCQVEFLSMKLASVDQLDFNMDSVLSKDVNNSTYPLESSSLFGQQKQETHQAETEFSTRSVDPSDNIIFRDISLQFPFVDNYGQSFAQFSGSYEDDLQSIVQMEFGYHSQSFPGSSDTTHMSIEL